MPAISLTLSRSFSSLTTKLPRVQIIGQIKTKLPGGCKARRWMPPHGIPAVAFPSSTSYGLEAIAFHFSLGWNDPLWYEDTQARAFHGKAGRQLPNQFAIHLQRRRRGAGQRERCRLKHFDG